MVTKASGIDVWWRCLDSACHYEWSTKINSRTTRGGNNCPECYTSKGFNNTKPATLYIVADNINGYHIVQFGISNKIKRRLRAHYRSGFISGPIALISFATGREARITETKLKRLMKEQGIPNCTQIGIKFDGSTEAFRTIDTTQQFKANFEQLVG